MVNGRMQSNKEGLCRMLLTTSTCLVLSKFVQDRGGMGIYCLSRRKEKTVAQQNY